MGKWSEETIQRKSEEFSRIAAEYTPEDFSGLERHYHTLKGEKSFHEERLREYNKRIAVIEALFAERFAEQDIKTMNFDSGHRVTVRFESPLKTEDKPAFIEWLKTSGLESELTIYDQRLKSISKNFLQETGSLPPGIVQGDPVAIVSYTKSK